MSVLLYIAGGGHDGLCVEMNGKETVSDLYLKVASETGLLTDDFKLLFEGNPIEDAQGMAVSISSLGLSEGYELKLALQERCIVVNWAVLNGRGDDYNKRSGRFEAAPAARDVSKAVAKSPETPLVIDVSGTDGVLSLPKLPEGVRYLRFTYADPTSKPVKEIEHSFLMNCSSIVTIDFTGLSEVTTIGQYFLYGCSNLRSANLAPLTGLSHISDFFVSCCCSLEEISLPASRITAVHSGFLMYCDRLQTIDLTMLTGVRSVGSSFLAKCTSLRSVDLTPLSAIDTISDEFLHHCRSLETVDLTPLGNVSCIHSEFLACCTSLKALDLAPLAGVRKIGKCFLRGCTALEGKVDTTPIAGVLGGVQVKRQKT
eukprot:TRINITY_DN285_c0_g1_i1.p1 TRINITY_DN285_c0_g1~~TRINITY_DN285_c0_g1_i1.p1  ORF type:complete len:371 (+),score=18.25 TRINITY_DN285_c0_g1_i1:51-1163(+)